MPSPSTLAHADASPENTTGGVWAHSRPGATDLVKPFYRPYTVVWSDGTVQHIQVLGSADWASHEDLDFSGGRRIIFAMSGHVDGLAIRGKEAPSVLPYTPSKTIRRAAEGRLVIVGMTAFALSTVLIAVLLG